MKGEEEQKCKIICFFKIYTLPVPDQNSINFGDVRFLFAICRKSSTYLNQYNECCFEIFLFYFQFLLNKNVIMDHGSCTWNSPSDLHQLSHKSEKIATAS